MTYEESIQKLLAALMFGIIALVLSLIDGGLWTFVPGAFFAVLGFWVAGNAIIRDQGDEG